ncbi:MAG: hypothetical protein ACKVN9_02255 [Methylophilaceae bacterium]
MKKFLFLLLLLISPHLLAAAIEDPEPEQDARVKMTTVEPERDVGYTMGDLITRSIILKVKKPYVLQETSLPIVGYEKRRKGQVSGIELAKITTEQAADADTTTYTLHLTYQVFTSNVVAKPAALPPEFIKFTDNKTLFEYRIPSWSFRISPLAVFGSVIVEKDMSGFRGPLLLDAAPEKQRLKWFGIGLALSLLGLLYILAANDWLPGMGGAFAKAYRDIRKLPNNAEGLQQSVERVHQALNACAGASVFSADGLIARHSAFAGLKAEIEQFFLLSRTVFFEPTASNGLKNPEAWLRQFCLNCRHIERGLGKA